MMPATNALPARTENGEVVLPDEHVFRLAPQAVAQVCVVEVPVMQAKALPCEPDRARASLEVRKVRSADRGRTYFA